MKVASGFEVYDETPLYTWEIKMNIELLVRLLKQDPSLITDEIIHQVKVQLKESNNERDKFILADLIQDWSFTPSVIKKSRLNLLIQE